MKTTIEVATGEVKAGDKTCILMSRAIGSCIVVTAWDPINQVGGMAHIMLPGKAPEKKNKQKTKYAEDAIDMLIRLLDEKDVSRENPQVCLIGSGNVLKRPDNRICKDNLQSAETILQNRYLPIRRRAVGGTLRRSALLDTESGNVYYTRGDSKEMLLWGAPKK